MKRTGPLLLMITALLLFSAVAATNVTPTRVVAQAITPGGPPPGSGDSGATPSSTRAGNKPQAPADTPTATNTPAGCTDTFEPDNTSATANTLNIGQSQSHTFCKSASVPDNDEDWTKVNLQAYHVYDIKTSALGSNVDTILYLYDANNAFIISDDNSGGGLASRIVFTPTAAATFLIQAVNKNSAGGFGPTWGYDLSISDIGQVTPTPTSAITTTVTLTPTPVCIDSYENDNNINLAKPIDVGGSQSHIICNPGDLTQSGDIDFVYFSAAAGTPYSMRTKDLAVGLDTTINLYNSSHVLIASNDNCPGNVTGDFSSCLNDVVFNSTGIYYISVLDIRPRSGGFNHTYTLQVTGGGFVNTPTQTQTQTVSPTATAAPTGTPCLDAYENDGVPEAAKPLLVNETQAHIFCPSGDSDWVTFHGKPGKTYTIATSASSPAGLGVDTYMYLFNSALGTPLITNDDFEGSLYSRIDFSPVVDDQYYIQVKNNDVGSPSATYLLTLLVAPGSVPPTFPPTGVATSTTPVTGTVTVVPTFTPQPLGSFTPTPTPETATPLATGKPAAPTDTPTPGGKPTDTPLPNAPPTDTPEPNQPPTDTPPPTQPLVPITGKNLALASVVVKVFIDRNHNGVADPGEGLDGLTLTLFDPDGNVDAQATTDPQGQSGGLVIPYAYHRLNIPYLALFSDLFAGINPHLPALGEGQKATEWDIALPPPALPNRIP